MNDQEKVLENEIRQLPKRNLDKKISEQIWGEIELKSKKKRDRWPIIITPIVAAIAIVLILVISNLEIDNRKVAINNNELVALSNEIEESMEEDIVVLFNTYVPFEHKEKFKISKKVLEGNIFQVIAEQEVYKIIIEEDFSNEFEVKIRVKQEIILPKYPFTVSYSDVRPINEFFNEIDQVEVTAKGKGNVVVERVEVIAEENLIEIQADVSQWIASDLKETMLGSFQYGLLPSMYENFSYITQSQERDKTFTGHELVILNSYVKLPDKKENYNIYRTVNKNQLLVKVEHKSFPALNEFFIEAILPEGEIEFWLKKEVLDEEMKFGFYTTYDLDTKTFKKNSRIEESFIEYTGNKFLFGNSDMNERGIVVSGSNGEYMEYLMPIGIRANRNHKDVKDIEQYLLENDYMKDVGERIYIY